MANLWSTVGCRAAAALAFGANFAQFGDAIVAVIVGYPMCERDPTRGLSKQRLALECRKNALLYIAWQYLTTCNLLIKVWHASLPKIIADFAAEEQPRENCSVCVSCKLARPSEVTGRIINTGDNRPPIQYHLS